MFKRLLTGYLRTAKRILDENSSFSILSVCFSYLTINRVIKNISVVFITILLIIFFLSAGSIAFAKDDSIKVFNLKNGHTVVIKEVHENPIVTIDTWIKTGSSNENDKNNGVSHFLEHLLFKGTKNHKNGEAEKILESKGAVYNAATSKDFTHYYTTIASQHAETALDLQADMLLNAVIPPDELERERKVVQEEIRRSLDNPDRIMFNNLNNLLFKSHPYKYETLGTIETIQNIPREEILGYYHKWYTPSNMTTVIVGDINTDKILALVKEKFKTASSSNKAIKTNYPQEPYISQYSEKVEKGNYNVGYIEIGFKGMPIWNKKENYALDLAAAILGQGRTSRLYQNVKEEQNLVTSISAGHHSLKDDSIFFIDANIKPENYNSAKDAIFKEMEKLRTGKVTKDELKRAKTQLQRAFMYNSESVENIAGAIGNNMTIGGSLDYYTDYIDDVNKITEADIQKAVNKYLPPSRMALSALLPENTNISQVKAQETYEDTSKAVLDNGMTLITEKNNSNDIISLSVFVKGGKLTESTPGLTNLIAETLLKGTKNRTNIEISRELEDSGIIINPSSNSDAFEIQLKSTVADFDKAFDILVDIINNPAFKEEFVKKAKSDIIQEIVASRDTPISHAFEKYTMTLYPDHPYGHTGENVEKNISKIQREDLVKYHNEYFIPENMVVAVSGKTDTIDLNKFNSYFPESQGKKVSYNNLVAGYKPLKEKNLSFLKKDTTAASMVLGWPTVGIANDKEATSLKIMNAILGNGLSSRLFVELREKQGLAYVVSSAYPTRLDYSSFMLYIGTKPENIVTVKNYFLKEINRLKTEEISEKELNDAKQKIIGQFALSQETNQEKAHNLGWFETAGKGFKQNYTYPELVNSITSRDIINTANKYFNDSYILSVVAPKGDIERLEKEYNSESKR